MRSFKRGREVFLIVTRTLVQRAARPGWLAAVLLAASGISVTEEARAGRLECVPYARQVSGIEIYGNAHLWWEKAEGRYLRGEEPRIGAVMAFQPTSAMPLGHVAVVSEVVDDRRVLLDHANWSGPGAIERGALAEDVSEAGDWSAVRVWWSPDGRLGARVNPVFGFIYNEPSGIAPDDRVVTVASGKQSGG